jgi:hypothetical protein
VGKALYSHTGVLAAGFLGVYLVALFGRGWLGPAWAPVWVSALLMFGVAALCAQIRLVLYLRAAFLRNQASDRANRPGA